MSRNATRVVENEEPDTLLQRDEGVFASFVAQTGRSSSRCVGGNCGEVWEEWELCGRSCEQGFVEMVGVEVWEKCGKTGKCGKGMEEEHWWHAKGPCVGSGMGVGAALMDGSADA